MNTPEDDLAIRSLKRRLDYRQEPTRRSPWELLGETLGWLIIAASIAALFGPVVVKLWR